MRTFLSMIIRILIAYSISLTALKAQNSDLITARFEDRIELTAKSMLIRNMRNVKLRVDAHAKQEVQYTTHIVANKAGLQRNFGDGRLYIVVQNGRAILEFRPQPGEATPAQEQSWIKAMFSKKDVFGRTIRVERADVSVMVPSDIDLQIDSQYTDLWVKGMRHSLNILNRYGKVYVEDHQGEARVDQDYGDVNIAKMTGDLVVQSRYGKVDVQDHSGDVVINTNYGKSRLDKAAEGGSLQLTGNYSRFDVTSSAQSLIFDGKYNTANLQVQPSSIGGSLRINQSYSTVTVQVLENVRVKYQLTNHYGSFEHNLDDGGQVKLIKTQGLTSGGPVGAKYEVWVTNRYGTVKVRK